MLSSFIRQQSSVHDKSELEKSVFNEMLEALKPEDEADASDNESVSSSFSVIDWPYDNVPATPLNSALSRIRQLSISLERVTILPNSLLGCGGYGDVRLARLDDPNEGTRLVAVKALRPIGESQERERIAVRLVREIDLWAKLRHPNILPLIGFHLQSDHTVAWLISHRCSKGNSLEYLKEAKPDETHRVQLISDTAKGLQYLHEFEPPIYHGDLKATNVLITDEARAVLCDFGLAKVMEEQTGLTTTTSLKGSTRYLSPEVAFETSGRTPKSDIWAWGCLILEIMAERIPYQDVKQDGRVFIKLHERELPVDFSRLRLPDHIVKLMQVCWSFDPEERPHVSTCVRMIEDSYRRLSRSGTDLFPTAILEDYPLRASGQSVAPRTSQHLPGSVVPGACQLPETKSHHVYGPKFGRGLSDAGLVTSSNPPKLPNASFNPDPFGGSLEDIMRLQSRMVGERTVPLVLSFLSHAVITLGGLQQKYIFCGISDNTVVLGIKDRINKLNYNLGDIKDPHVAATLLKMWLMELKEPILPNYDFRTTAAADRKEAVDTVKNLPKLNRAVVLFLTSFLQMFLAPEVSLQTGVDRDDLAREFAPCLIRDGLPKAFGLRDQAAHRFMLYLFQTPCEEIDPLYSGPPELKEWWTN